MSFAVNTRDIGQRDVWIHYTNIFGTHIFSKKITIVIRYNCRYDKIYINPFELVAEENPPEEMYFERRNVNN